jgi:hypothetical protein
MLPWLAVVALVSGSTRGLVSGLIGSSARPALRRWCLVDVMSRSRWRLEEKGNPVEGHQIRYVLHWNMMWEHYGALEMHSAPLRLAVGSTTR